MEVSYNDAVAIFNSFSPDLQAPSLHPYYVKADAQRDSSLQPVFFVYQEGFDLYYHAFHRSRVNDTGFFDIQSPYGYGGPLSTTEDKPFLAKAWSEFLIWGQQNQILAEFLRFHPLLENWRFFNGEVFDDRSTVWVDLMERDLLMSYKSRVRTAVRKAQKNSLQVEWLKEPQAIRDFIEIYSEAMRGLNAGHFYFFPDSYYQELLNWDQSHLAVCKLGENVLAAAIFLVSGARMEYHLSGSTTLGNQMGATNLLIHEASLLGMNLGCKMLHLGGGIDNNPQNSLLFFKAGFSDCRAFFRIGKQIHLPEVYERMRREWREKYGRPASRVLFYRFNS